MKSVSLEQINKAILALVDTKTDTQLYSQIAQTAKTLIDADYVKLSIFVDNKLKNVYCSDKKVKPNTLVSNKKFSKFLSSKEIFTFTDGDLQKIKTSNLPSEIKFLVVIPLLHAQQQLGFIYIYFKKDKQKLTDAEKELLTLYSHTAVLTLNKVLLQEQSQQALEIRDRFISLASHELRTPLTSIHGYIQLLHNRMKDKETLEARWINELYIESIRMTTLVKELLDVNRIKQGQFAFVYSEVPLQDVIARAIERYRLTNANHPFEFQCKLTDHQSRVVGDFDKLVEMVSGLLGNAVRFSKPGEKITVMLKNSTNNGILSLEVTDTGKGISKQDLTAIFSGFYKPEQASYIEGMGVGLLLARHIVDNHRGKLKIKSKKNKGTTVTVTLPTIKKV